MQLEAAMICFIFNIHMLSMRKHMKKCAKDITPASNKIFLYEVLQLDFKEPHAIIICRGKQWFDSL